MITEKKYYSAPSMNVVPLVSQMTLLLEGSNKETTPELPPGFIGEASIDPPHNA